MAKFHKCIKIQNRAETRARAQFRPVSDAKWSLLNDIGVYIGVYMGVYIAVYTISGAQNRPNKVTNEPKLVSWGP